MLPLSMASRWLHCINYISPPPSIIPGMTLGDREDILRGSSLPSLMGHCLIHAVRKQDRESYPSVFQHSMNVLICQPLLSFPKLTAPEEE